MSFTVGVHHHFLPNLFWRETYDAHNPVGGIAPPPWDADLMLSFMDEAVSTWPRRRSRRRASGILAYQ
jgi:6-methylsalicylate decarboxylase